MRRNSMVGMDSCHIPVLLDETVEALALHQGDWVIDATVGHGGHAEKIVRTIGERGRLLAIDCDLSNLEKAQKRLSHYKKQIVYVHSQFDQLERIAHEYDFFPHAIVLDLGVSSSHLDVPERGFSFLHNGPLDMRLDSTTNQERACDIIQNTSENDLKNLFEKYGEEAHARRIAHAIIERRGRTPFMTTHALAECVEQAIPARVQALRRKKHQHPATKIFQALRIAVNDELGQLERVLPQAVSVLHTRGGRLAVISFHSLEDRMVKQFFVQQSNPCVCPPDFPVCSCHKKPTLRLVHRKPIIPTHQELINNPRSRSAKLRVADIFSV